MQGGLEGGGELFDGTVGRGVHDLLLAVGLLGCEARDRLERGIRRSVSAEHVHGLLAGGEDVLHAGDARHGDVGGNGHDGGQRDLDGLDDVLERALDHHGAFPCLDLRRSGHHGQAELGSQLHVGLLRVVVGRAVTAEDEVVGAHLLHE